MPLLALLPILLAIVSDGSGVSSCCGLSGEFGELVPVSPPVELGLPLGDVSSSLSDSWSGWYTSFLMYLESIRGVSGGPSSSEWLPGEATGVPPPDGEGTLLSPPDEEGEWRVAVCVEEEVDEVGVVLVEGC